jgi:hypothetical protein
MFKGSYNPPVTSYYLLKHIAIATRYGIVVQAS